MGGVTFPWASAIKRKALFPLHLELFEQVKANIHQVEKPSLAISQLHFILDEILSELWTYRGWHIQALGTLSGNWNLAFLRSWKKKNKRAHKSPQAGASKKSAEDKLQKCFMCIELLSFVTPIPTGSLQIKWLGNQPLLQQDTFMIHLWGLYS